MSWSGRGDPAAAKVRLPVIAEASAVAMVLEPLVITWLPVAGLPVAERLAVANQARCREDVRPHRDVDRAGAGQQVVEGPNQSE